jgi:hypothetical protein
MLHLDGSDGVLPVHGDEVVLLERRAGASLPTGTAARFSESSGTGGVGPGSATGGGPATEGEEARPETVVGRVTSAARHHELGPIALAVIKRTVDPLAGLAVLAEGIRIAAAQEVIVPPDAGAEANVPRLPRLGSVRR